MKLLNLGIADCIGGATFRENASQPVLSLLFPRAHLVRVKLMLRRNLLDRLVAPKSFQGDFGLKLV